MSYLFKTGAIFCLMVLWIIGFSVNAGAEQVLFYDDFNGTGVDQQKWDVANWTLGRSAFGAVPVSGTEGSTDYLRFSMNTYDPNSAGSLLLSSSLYSASGFSLESGLICEARLRVVNATMPGQVGAFFLYQQYGDLSDEIDFEFLTKQPTNQVLITTWNDWKSGYTQNDGVHHSDANPVVNGMDFSQWTTVRILWQSGMVRWEVNGVEVGQSSQAVPDQDMKLFLSLWAPASSWTAAYDASLAPTADAGSAREYYMDVDYVKVSRESVSVPALDTSGLVGTGALLLLSFLVCGRLRNRNKDLF